jgi:flagellar assembly protein FliH
MGKILNAEEGKHLVESFQFKPLNLDDNSFSNHFQPISMGKESDSESETSPSNKNATQEVSNNDNQNNKLVEELLKKNDEFSSSLVKMEMMLEKQQEEFSKQLAEVKELAYKDGYAQGVNDTKTQMENEFKEHINKLIESIHKIEEIYKEYQTKAEGIEKELVGVAVDIAEEVIQKELSENSKEIALNLTKELINDIKEATKIEIKVNPADFEYIEQNLNLEKVKIIPDNAISAGGVVLLSDVGNIEAEIKERFRTMKNHILKGQE